MQLKALLNPASVAIIGASGTRGKVGHAILNNVISGGFQGKIVPINPKEKAREEVSSSRLFNRGTKANHTIQSS